MGCGVEGSSNWYASSELPGGMWMWKGNASPDTITAHYFAYSVIFDLVARSKDEKLRVNSLILSITDYIVQNDYVYLDITGKPTTHGVWKPRLLNNDRKYINQRGGNSLQILSYLAVTYSISGNLHYYDEYMRLGNAEGYFKNVLSVKIDNPLGDNHSDNHVTFMAFHVLFYSYYRLHHGLSMGAMDTQELSIRRMNVLQMLSPIIPGLMRWWAILESERSPLWVSLVAGVANMTVSPESLAYGKKTLEQFPLDMLDWDIRNTPRWDYVTQPYEDSSEPSQGIMYSVKPIIERKMTHYDRNPLLIDTTIDDVFVSAGGYIEYASTEWLLPYWMMRLYNLIE